MPGRNRFLAAGAALAVLAVVPGPARAGEYCDPAHHFTVDLPKGWTTIPPRELKAINARTDRENPGLDIAFVVGFRSAVDRPEAMPLVLVQVDTEVTPGTSFDAYVADLNRDHQAALKQFDREAHIRLHGRLLHAARAIKADKERKWFRCVPGDDVFFKAGPPGGMWWSGSYGFVGPDRVVLLHTAGGTEEGSPYAKIFARMADSFKWDESAASTDARPVLERMITTPAGEVARPAVVGGAVALGVLVIGGLTLIQQRGRAKPARPW